MSQTFKLYRLQQIDSQIDQFQARLGEIENILAQDVALSAAQRQANSAAASLESARKALRNAEDHVKNQRVKIEQSEAALYGGMVRNPKELQDLQNEVASLKKYLSVLEDRQLDEMIAVEEAQAIHEAAQGHLHQTESQSANQNRQLSQEKVELSQEIERLGIERSAALKSIIPEDLNLYEQLRQQRRGVAVARVSDECCSACGSTLSSAMLHAARSPSRMARCDTCGRILYGG